jgi:hypothetical protein
MSVVLNLQRLPKAEIAKLRRRTWGDDSADDMMEILERWEEGPAHCDLDALWQGIHFLLTGTADGGDEPACLLLKGGDVVPGFDLGFEPGEGGPTRALNPEQVSRFAVCLAQHTRETLRARYDTKRMLELDVYLADTFDAEGEQGFEYLFESFTELKRVVDEASAAAEGLIIYFS